MFALLELEPVDPSGASAYHKLQIVDALDAIFQVNFEGGIGEDAAGTDVCCGTDSLAVN